jgi:plastocyanin
MARLHRALLVALAGAVVAAVCLAAAPAGGTGDQQGSAEADAKAQRLHVVVPKEDRFVPYNLTIHAGDLVVWVNNDTDDHSIVSDDNFSTTGPRRLDKVLPGTDSNHGKPGRFAIHFDHPGTFVYFCRFHAHLDDHQQPVAPGPKGGIQDPDGNHGTPMTGLITVLP